MRTILIAAMISLLSANCGSDDTEEETASSSTEINTETPVVTSPNNPVTVPNSITGSSNNSTAPVTTQTTSTGVKSGAGLNPAHGQPGHRCDIAVGAPLDSKPVTTTQSAPSVNVQPANSNPSNITVNGPPPANLVNNQPSSATTVGAGMNPAHGQPGHRCDIPVGAPLTSKPSTTPQILPAKQ